MTMFGVVLLSVAILCAALPVSFANIAYNLQVIPDWTFNENSSTGVGPSYWHLLPGYGACAGQNQSPIDIHTQKTVTLHKDLRLYNYDTYDALALILRNDGRTVNVNFDYGDITNITRMPYISGGNLKGFYKLINIHFHWGSVSSRGAEHRLNGRQYPIEVHLVHIKSNYDTLVDALSSSDGVAVLGAMYEISLSDNPHLDKLLRHFQSVKYKNQSAITERINIYDILPDNHEYTYTYFGSLTTPPCSEAVTWNVVLNPAPISEAQMQIFRSLQQETEANNPLNNMPLVDNYRPIQELNGREIGIIPNIITQASADNIA